MTGETTNDTLIANARDSAGPSEESTETAVEEKAEVERARPLGPTHAASALTWLGQEAARRSRDTRGTTFDHAVPLAATAPDVRRAVYAPIPAGGIASLVHTLWPDDSQDDEKVAGHIGDILMMNRDVIRDDTTSTVGTHVRIA